EVSAERGISHARPRADRLRHGRGRGCPARQLRPVLTRVALPPMPTILRGTSGRFSAALRKDACALGKSCQERWPSGLRRTLGKRVYGKPYRGFESHLLRQFLKVSRFYGLRVEGRRFSGRSRHIPGE